MNIENEITKRRGPIPGTIRPHHWKSGPDPEMHRHFKSYVQQRNQANWRQEGWDKNFTFDKWVEFWGDKLSLRGRKVGSYMMIRLNTSSPWSFYNVELKYNKGKKI